ncbi:MAG TPA: histidinol-phosphate transaminase [Gammaproteobacteria bacterium]|nr:histidinol-phosphate transaminase [Gammaproteobacteria bacterium]
MSWERKNIAAMQGYISGEQPDDPSILKLNTNENPYPPAPAIEEMLQRFSSEVLRKYPPPNADEFREIAATLHDVESGNIIATRGGDELLRLMITTFVDPGEMIGTTQPTYSLYPVLAQIQNCPITHVPLTADWKPPESFSDQLNDADVKLTLLVNPNAPSGVLVEVEQIEQIARSLNGILLLDEAYVDFADNSYDAIPLIEELDNLVILRTLSKAYSLAGLRLGYGIGPEHLIRPMIEKTRDSYNLDWISQKIASIALEEQGYANQTWLRVIQERDALRTELLKLGFLVPNSQTNFLLATVPKTHTAESIYVELKQRNILVRFFDQVGLSDKLRITIGTAEQNHKLITELSSILISQ